MEGNSHPRSQAPDVIVVVGQGECKQEFNCYKLGLAFSSPYLDAMLSTDMAEKISGRIEFPDKDPEEWKLFYQFIDPIQIRATKVATTYSVENSMTLTPWFHEFEMQAHLANCDDALDTSVRTLSRKSVYNNNCIDDAFWDKGSQPLASRLEERKSSFNKIIELLCFAVLYDLGGTKIQAEDTIEQFMQQAFEKTSDLFDVHAVTSLVDLFLPLEEEVDDFGNKIYVPKGKSTAFWYCLDETFREKELSSLPVEAINNKEMFSMLLRTHLKYNETTQSHRSSSIAS